MSDTLLKQFTGAQKGGKSYTQHGGLTKEEEEEAARLGSNTQQTQQTQQTQDALTGENTDEKNNFGGRRRRNTKNSWLSHVKATMKMHRGKSFKQVLKLAKKSYKKSQSSSQSHSGGRRRKSKVSKNRRQRGGSSVAEYAGAYPN